MNYFSPLLYSKASTPATSDKTPDPVNIKNSVLLPSYEINSSKARNKTDHLGYDPGVD